MQRRSEYKLSSTTDSLLLGEENVRWPGSCICCWH